MNNFLEKVFWNVIPKKIYALVGPPGTGKSFRAFLVADKYKIKYIIDDGLLIKDQQILAGKSAKEEKYHVSAVKTAIFYETKHAREVRKALQKELYRSLLILGTSENMVNKICKRLHLQKITKIIHIEDISSEEDIKKAQESRLRNGEHVIPIPMMVVKKEYPNIAVKVFHDIITKEKKFFFLKKETKQIIDKTIVRPSFGLEGNITISETTLLQMVSHCIAEYSTKIKLQKVSIIEQKDSFALALDINVDFSMNTPENLAMIQKIVKTKIEQFTGIAIKKVDINIIGTYT